MRDFLVEEMPSFVLQHMGDFLEWDQNRKHQEIKTESEMWQKAFDTFRPNLEFDTSLCLKILVSSVVPSNKATLKRLLYLLQHRFFSSDKQLFTMAFPVYSDLLIGAID